MVLVGGRWVPKEEAERLQGQRRDPDERRRAPQPPAITKPEYVTCPKCGGTGIEVWIPCSQCSRSPRPGYLNMGDHLEICPRCKGAGKLPGIRCRQCGGTGKVDLNKPRTVTGRYVQKGYHVCPDCGGTGVELWIECNQCKRSGVPGFLFHGEYYSVCNRCGGLGKLPGIPCATCKGYGVVKDED
jgi:DnaJ-class molecular chaperone